MRPFLTDTFFVELNFEEAVNLRHAVDHMRDLRIDFPESYEFQVYNQMYQDLTKIIEKIPF